jgi:hypothetical protein
MSDIVERLNDRCELLDDGRLLVCKDHEAVKDLRAEVGRLAADLVEFRNAAADEMIKLRAEIERLRAALKDMLDDAEPIVGSQLARRIARIARRALEGK